MAPPNVAVSARRIGAVDDRAARVGYATGAGGTKERTWDKRSATCCPSAIGVALSPVPIIAVILMLGTPRARSNGPAFAVGWVLGLVVVSVIVLLVAGDADDPDSGTSTAVDVVKLAARRCSSWSWRSSSGRGGPRPGETAEMPKWMSAVDSFTPGQVARARASLLSGAQPEEPRPDRGRRRLDRPGRAGRRRERRGRRRLRRPRFADRGRARCCSSCSPATGPPRRWPRSRSS